MKTRPALRHVLLTLSLGLSALTSSLAQAAPFDLQAFLDSAIGREVLDTQAGRELAKARLYYFKDAIDGMEGNFSGALARSMRTLDNRHLEDFFRIAFEKISTQVDEFQAKVASGEQLDAWKPWLEKIAQDALSSPISERFEASVVEFAEVYARDNYDRKVRAFVRDKDVYWTTEALRQLEYKLATGRMNRRVALDAAGILDRIGADPSAADENFVHRLYWIYMQEPVFKAAVDETPDWISVGLSSHSILDVARGRRILLERIRQIGQGSN